MVAAATVRFHAANFRWASTPARQKRRRAARKEGHRGLISGDVSVLRYCPSRRQEAISKIVLKLPNQQGNAAAGRDRTGW